ncbi:MAG: TlpA disulfide reductase family protein [Sphaerobacter sp.]|nr:TlpA disulfide reductase family protein [Sphaerobacter sp.]
MQPLESPTAASLAGPAPPGYNYPHLTTGVVLDTLRRTVRGGLQPGSLAPDFALATTEGEPVRLGALRGQPVLLIFGSVTCPMTRGGIPALKRLYAEGGADAARWFQIVVREAHPGSRVPAPATEAEKIAHARALKELEALPWPVLVDDLGGTVHRAYGGLPNAAYLIDADGRVAFKDQWASAATLRVALDALREHEGRAAPVAGGVERAMHLLGPMAFGWPAIQRAGKPAGRGLWLAAPPLALLLWGGRFLRPILAPLAGRGRPLPTAPKLAAALAMAGGLWLLLRGRVSSAEKAEAGAAKAAMQDRRA